MDDGQAENRSDHKLSSKKLFFMFMLGVLSCRAAILQFRPARSQISLKGPLPSLIFPLLGGFCIYRNHSV